MTATDPQVHPIALTPSRYWRHDTDADPRERDRWDGDVVLVTPTGNHRHKVGYIGPRGLGRRVYQGDELPGPYLYAYGLATAITADPRMSTAYESDQLRRAGKEFVVRDGDRVAVPGAEFRVRILRREHIEFDLIDEEGDVADGPLQRHGAMGEL